MLRPFPLIPLFLICGIDIVTDIASPVHSSCFGVSNIGNVVESWISGPELTGIIGYASSFSFNSGIPMYGPCHTN
jgi:hypothetical protein